MKTLRPYQEKAVFDCLEALEEFDDPVLLMSSVGSGKSLMMSEVVKFYDRVLCLVSSAELVRNNSDTYREQGGRCSIFCSSLGIKDSFEDVVFGTSQSIISAIKKGEKIANKTFDLIVIDEAHCVNYKDSSTAFIKILQHYKLINDKVKILGATGTNYRFKGEPIVGDHALFRHQVADISTDWLIKNDYLVKPQFDVLVDESIDFSECKVMSNGKFNGNELTRSIAKQPRKTGEIMKSLSTIMVSQGRFGVFVFASSIEHCHECMEYLPSHLSAIITGETPQKKREEILNKARQGEIKYLVNVSVLTVGIDVPGYDTVCYVRPTESLVLLVQTMGRGLRLYPGKKDCLVIDCAGNIDRHADWDDPLLEDALKPKDDTDVRYVIPCGKCATVNKITARRCRHFDDKGKRCDYYFEYVDCEKCDTRNDIAARQCRNCQCELIDPNDKLKSMSILPRVEVDKLMYRIVNHSGSNTPILQLYYYAANGGNFQETYYTNSKKAQSFFYYGFIKEHLDKPSRWWGRYDKDDIKSMMKSFKSPTHIYVKGNKIVKKEISNG